MSAGLEVPSVRVERLNEKPVRPDGEYVVYWMTANRRLTYNFALQRAVEHSSAIGKPLVVLEAIRSDYRWASDRMHKFVVEGMRDKIGRAHV